MLKIPNRQARWLWLEAQGLSTTPTGKLDLIGIIRQLGLVQLDTIEVIARAHHHILWSRNQNYREGDLNKLLKSRQVFEHFSHDACVMPMEHLPYWQRQFTRHRDRILNAGWFKSMPDAAGRAEIIERIRREGPLSTHDFDTKIIDRSHAWARPPHKLGLDFLWYSGELATCHRRGFTKVYDLAERVFPADLRAKGLAENTQIDRLCHSALLRLAFGTTGEIQRFWEAMTAKEARIWSETANLEEVLVQGADRSWSKAYALQGIEERLSATDAPTSRLRILNPFDPVVRDRTRLARLFGFDYRIEIFVPKVKRRWGYYVYPLLEGDRFVGRIEAKADRKAGHLTVLNLWPEPGVRWGAARGEKLSAELARMARFVGVSDVHWSCPFP